MERNQLLAIVVIVVVIAGAGVAFVFMQPTRAPENTLIWETIGNPDYLDPHVDYETFGSWISFNVYETLYTYPWDSAETDPSVPLLAAAAPVITDGGTNYTITLREGITFHDGTAFNASVVKWNFERAMKIFYLDGPVWMFAEVIKGGSAVEAEAGDWGTSSSNFTEAFDEWVANSNSIIVVDEYTIRFILESPYPAFIAAITYEVGAMISPTYALAHATDAADGVWAKYGVDYGEYDNYMAEHTCGTGPYMMTRWNPDQYIQLNLYTDYWRADATDAAVAPEDYSGKIEKVVIKTNEDVNGRSLNLKTGRSDVVYWPTTNALDIYDPDTGDSLDANIHVDAGSPTFSVMFFGFNMAQINTTAGNSFLSPFANKDFRHAASYAFDYDAFMNAAVNGFGIQAKGPIPYGMFGYNATAYTFAYNLTAAVEAWNLALQDSAFIDSMNALDNKLTIYYNSGNTVREQGSLLLADGLKNMTADAGADDQLAAGMDAEMTFTTQALEWSNYLDYIRNRQMPIFFVGWAPDYADPDNYVFPFCYEAGTYAGRIGFNNSQVNAYYLLAKAETNLTLRMHYYNVINDILAEEAPYLWVYQATDFRTWRTWVHGVGLVYNPMHGAYFFNMYKDYATT